MSFLDKIVSWFTPTKKFTDQELLAGPDSDTIDHGFHYSEEDYIRVLEYRKRAHVLSERQIRLIDIRVAHLQQRIVDREARKLEKQQVTARRQTAEEIVNEIEKRTPSVRVPQPSGGSTPVKSTERLVDRIADVADSLPSHGPAPVSHSPSPASHHSSPSVSVSYSSHKSCHSSSYDGGSSSSSDSSSSSSSGSSCD
ncbi:hypothetical protein D3C80_1089990 [compost metagenome]